MIEQKTSFTNRECKESIKLYIKKVRANLKRLEKEVNKTKIGDSQYMIVNEFNSNLLCSVGGLEGWILTADATQRKEKNYRAKPNRLCTCYEKN